MQLQLRASDIDDIEKVVLSENDFSHLNRPIRAMTVGALLELTCRAWDWKRKGIEEAVDIARAWTRQYPVFGKACLALGKLETISPPLPFEAPKFEMFLLSSPESDRSLQWQYHTERMARSLKEAGFSKKLADGLSAAYYEMGDNVFEHSGADEQNPASALTAYCVGDRQMTFGVADIGRGVLTSLRSKPQWSHLSSSEEALACAVQNRATRRRDHDKGNGFWQVHRSIADLNGTLRFRTGNSALMLEGVSEAERHVAYRDSPEVAGFQLSVSCALDSDLPELYI